MKTLGNGFRYVIRKIIFSGSISSRQTVFQCGTTCLRAIAAAAIFTNTKRVHIRMTADFNSIDFTVNPRLWRDWRENNNEKLVYRRFEGVDGMKPSHTSASIVKVGCIVNGSVKYSHRISRHTTRSRCYVRRRITVWYFSYKIYYRTTIWLEIQFGLKFNALVRLIPHTPSVPTHRTVSQLISVSLAWAFFFYLLFPFALLFSQFISSLVEIC